MLSGDFLKLEMIHIQKEIHLKCQRRIFIEDVNENLNEVVFIDSIKVPRREECTTKIFIAQCCRQMEGM